MKKFENYVSNLLVLSTAQMENLDNDFIISGIIDKFSIQFELSWKVLKELMRYEGKNEANTGSPREILNAAKRLVQRILKEYIPTFQKLKEDIIDYYGDAIDEIV